MSKQKTLIDDEPTTQLAVAEPTPMQLLQSALDQGVDTDKLRELLDLQERWERREAEKAFAVAMHEAQRDMPTVVTDATNTHTKSRYALKETVQKQVKPIYVKHGFSLSFGEDDCHLEGHKRTVCDVTHDLGHTRRYHLDLPVDGIGPKGTSIGGMNAVQGCVSTTSYAQRRLICMIFNLTVAGEDTDGSTTEATITPDQVATITPDQVARINGLLGKIHPDDQAGDKLLAWADIDRIDQLPQSRFANAVSSLEKQAAKYAEK